MIKGNERRVVVVKGGRDSLYDMACLFLRNDSVYTRENEDIIKEAEKILEGISEAKEEIKDEKEPLLCGKMLSFFAGSLVGAGISFASYLIVCGLFIT